jgi:hypothetical protein
MEVNKDTNNYKYIHGDFDRDGVPNIDDKRPFNPKVKKRVSKEVSMSKLFTYLDRKRHKAEVIGRRMREKEGFTSFRVKDNYSTINKIVRRNKFISNDYIGLRFEATKRKDVQKKWNKYNKRRHIPSVSKGIKVGGELIGSENKYKTLKGTNNLYRAFHSNWIVNPKSKKNQFGVEAQFRTINYGKFNDKEHKRYKEGKSVTKRSRSKSKYLLSLGE